MELFVIAVLLTVTGALQSQMEGPQHILSIVGSNVTLKCSTPSGNCIGVDWERSIPQNNPETVFSDRQGIYNAYRDRYSVNNSSGCDLVINDVKLMDAGRFMCRVVISPNTIERSAFLIILKTQPTCAINASLDDTLEGDGVQLTCEVTYNGTEKASMSWKDVKDTPAAVENGKTISQSYYVIASAPEVPSFTCVISFPVNDNGRNHEGLASNVPTTSCETPVIKVLYPVRNVTLSPSLCGYSPGTTITCAAMGHPPPSFKWQVREKENDCFPTWTDIQTQSSNQIALGIVTSARYRCLAMNVVRGVSCSATSHDFQVNNTDEFTFTSSSSSAVQRVIDLGISLGIGLLAAILLASIAFASLVRLGYVEFHRRPNNPPRDDVVQSMKQEKSSSSHQLSLIPSTETASDGLEESAYASLGNDRDTNEYESLDLRQKVKPKKKSKP